MSTPSQTVGPFLSIGLPWGDGPLVVEEGTPGGVWLRGVVTDGEGTPVPDALVETWQADPDGRFDHPDDPRGAKPGFRGFGRSETDENGEFGIHTLVPGELPGEAPHINVTILARGLLHRVVTRVYFPDFADANAADPVLRVVGEQRRSTLLATKTPDGYRFDVRLQGEGETVFFDV